MPGAPGLPVWMQYARHLTILPPISTAASSFRGYRIPRPAVDPVADTDGLICWGTVGNLPSPEPMPTFGFQVTGEEFREWGRKSELVRVQNPDDASQYIMDNRPTEISFKKTTRGVGAGANTSAATPSVDDPGFVEGTAPKGPITAKMFYNTNPTP